nr:ribosomal protein L2 [Nitzschia traheaformis]
MLLLQKVKPTTSSRRHLIKLNQKGLNLSKSPFLKNKVKGIKKNSNGRNHSGKITVFHKGGGVKQRYRKINFNRNFNSSGIVCSLEHDPNRNCYIASVYDVTNSNFFYMIAPKYLKVGDIVKSGLDIEPSLGSSLPLFNIAIGTPIYNISTRLNKEGQISRSAGTFSIIKEKNDQSVLIEFSSGEIRSISINCFACVGEVSKELFFLTRSGKAGRSRWLNKRPTVRGVAMNPVDHPHGGGEGKKSGSSKTPWGKSNHGAKTSRSKFKKVYEKI